MRYLSVCSGIEAASVAWHGLGWTPVAFSEIEKFPSAVLAHHYPNVPNWGDMTQFKEWSNESINLLVGGTPCQSFSVAGLRKGLADPRGNLLLTYLAIADKYRPEWLVWENVPGVLSSNEGKDFGTLLGGLAELGYGFAYRILDAQFHGVAQRRRRVFVVANARNWQRAAAVLFERHGLSGHPAPSRQTGQTTPCLSANGSGVSRTGFNSEERWFIPELSNALCSTDYKGPRPEADKSAPVIVERSISFPWQMGGSIQMPVDEEITGSLIKNQTYAVAIQDVSGREKHQNGQGWNADGVSYTVDATATQGVALNMAVAFDAYNQTINQNTYHTLTREGLSSNKDAVLQSMQVRRLTPCECERLQGFPDDYTLIPYRNKPASDGPRYKALGNSMAVPVMRWIGQRIQMVSTIADKGSN